LLVTITQFFALSNIPFMLGLIESPAHSILMNDMEGFTGIMGAVHATAGVMSTSTVILLYHLTHRKHNITGYIYNTLLVAITTYATYLAFTRTGWVMLVAGILIIFLPTKLKVVNIVFFCATIATIGFIAAKLYNEVEYVKYRVDDIDPDTETELLRGSGRNQYREISLNLWKRSPISEKFFGVGLTRVMDNMNDVMGARIFTHNGYIDSLVANGIIGLAMMLLYILSLFIFLIKHRHSQYVRMGFAILMQYVLYQATQGHNLFATDLLYAQIMALIAIKGCDIRSDKDENKEEVEDNEYLVD
ncbi:MAG: O-antigen ligase family protein, partial [Alistipes sp.]|nr:O-antigen ligase family protein [Alistipes sp.]